MRWKKRPEGSNWGDFGPDDQLGRLNLITPEKVLEGIAEVRNGRTFSLSLPLDLPGGNILNPSRFPPKLQSNRTVNGDPTYLRTLMDEYSTTDVFCDDFVTMYLQYSTQWDSFAHVGSQFDADDDGTAEIRFYNGFDSTGFERGTDDASHAHKLGIESMAAHGVQGRAVLFDLRRHFGDERQALGYDALMQVINADNIEVRIGDMLCIHTGFADLIAGMAGNPDPEFLANACAVLDGRDQKLLNWIDESGVAAIIADNYAVEARPYTFAGDGCCALLPLHEHCLFKLGIHLGELWHLSPLAAALHDEARSAFLLTAPPLRLPGAVGSPANPIATI
tara:strand:+ start:1766 stop:2770 length:1005 start_codon:yes stop_codon:yes gene_type:complete